MSDPHEAIDEAAAIALELGLAGIAAMLRQESDELERATMRALLLGPSSSGKTSSLLALMGDAGLDSNGHAIFPVSVAPTTAHLVEVVSGSSEFEARIRWQDGRTVSTTSAGDLQHILVEPDATLHRVLVNIPRWSGIAAPLVCIDTPGVGAFDSAFATELMEEALGIADVLLFHVRVPRGFGPAKAILERVRDSYPWPDELALRLVPVLTDMRTPGRVPEILEGMAQVLGFEPSTPVVVPRPGEVRALEEQIEAVAAEVRRRHNPRRRTTAILEHTVLPVLGATAERHMILRERRDASIAHIEEFRDRARSTANYIQERSWSARADANEGLEALARERVASARQHVETLIESSERFIFDTYKDEIARTLNATLVDEFESEAERYLLDVVTRMAEDCEDRLEAFEQSLEVGDIPIQPSGFVEVKASASKLGVDVGARRFLFYLNRLGGNGGILLGTMNLGRKVVSQAYRAVGKRASQNLIRSGVPNAVRGVGKALKFVGKNQWVIAIALEVIPLIWGVARARPKLRKELGVLTTAWLEGPRRSLWQKISREQPPPGQLAQLSAAVKQAWEGAVIENEDGGRTHIPGVNAQLDVALTALQRFMDDRDNELASLRVEASGIDSVEKRLVYLQSCVEALKGG